MKTAGKCLDFVSDIPSTLSLTGVCRGIYGIFQKSSPHPVLAWPLNNPRARIIWNTDKTPLNILQNTEITEYNEKQRRIAVKPSSVYLLPALKEFIKGLLQCLLSAFFDNVKNHLFQSAFLLLLLAVFLSLAHFFLTSTLNIIGLGSSGLWANCLKISDLAACKFSYGSVPDMARFIFSNTVIILMPLLSNIVFQA